jgi:hypothetical protein
MKNNIDKYGLKESDKELVRARDKNCVYCHKLMIYPYDLKNRNDSATIEHLNHLPPWNNPKTIAYCCGSCNSSRGKQKIRDWFNSSYCVNRNINFDTVSDAVKRYIKEHEDNL